MLNTNGYNLLKGHCKKKASLERGKIKLLIVKGIQGMGLWEIKSSVGYQKAIITRRIWNNQDITITGV